MNPTAVVAYLALFATVGFLFVFACLVLGRFLRAQTPTPEKREIYECGEPPVGSGFLQFDLRFYVVALVFIIFEVEVAFFFPWAAVFGKATHLADQRLPKVVAVSADQAASGSRFQWSRPVAQRLRELGVGDASAPLPAEDAEACAARIEHGARELAFTAVIDISVFFAVLLVGFAYVWHRGDLDWVRAVGAPSCALGSPADGKAGRLQVQRGDG